MSLVEVRGRMPSAGETSPMPAHTLDLRVHVAAKLRMVNERIRSFPMRRGGPFAFRTQCRSAPSRECLARGWLSFSCSASHGSYAGSGCSCQGELPPVEGKDHLPRSDSLDRTDAVSIGRNRHSWGVESRSAGADRPLRGTTQCARAVPGTGVEGDASIGVTFEWRGRVD